MNPNTRYHWYGSSRTRLLAVASVALVGACVCLQCSVALASRASRRTRLSHGLRVAPRWADGERVQFVPSPRAAVENVRTKASDSARDDVEGPPEELEYHPEAGGEGVEHTPKPFVIFWGSNFANTTSGRETRKLLETLYGKLSSSEYQGILTQYFDTKSHVSVTVTATFFNDTSVAAPAGIGKSAIREEAERIREAQGWPLEKENDQLIVVAAPGSTYEPGFEPSTGEGFCAYHALENKGQAYSFIPYEGDPLPKEKGCLESDGSESPVHETSRFASAVYADTVTDAHLNAWRTPAGREIDYGASGKPCAKELDLELSDGAWAQNLFDDHLLSCQHKDPSPPFVYALTRPAEAVNPTQATTTAIVNPENASTTYHFQWGQTISYGNTTPTETLTAGLTNENVKARLTGLQTETTYHYRIVAENSTGTTFGYDQTFTTLRAEPPFALTEEATNVDETTATIDGIVNPKKLATTFHFEWGTTTAYKEGKKKEKKAGEGSSNVPESENLTKLEPGTEYHYRIAAKSAGGEQPGLDHTFKTHGWITVPTPPQPESGVQLADVSCPTRDACIAVGFHDTNFSAFGGYPTESGFSESWNGAEWTRQPEVGAPEAALRSVSCWAANQCIGVGPFGVTGEDASEIWNGHEWRYLAPLTGHLDRSLSCTSATACTAVGLDPFFEFDPDGFPAISRWNGTEWKLELPVEPETQGEFTSVSCPSSEMCMATADFYQDDDGLELEHDIFEWNGSHWTKQDSLLNGSFETNEVDPLRVSCASTTACSATAGELAVHYSNGKWSAPETLPEPYKEEAKESSKEPLRPDVFGLNCPTATTCFAVGLYHAGEGLAGEFFEKFAENRWLTDRWNGTTWIVQQPPKGITTAGKKGRRTEIADPPLLEAVSCWNQTPEPPACLGVGLAKPYGERAHERETAAARYE